MDLPHNLQYKFYVSLLLTFVIHCILVHLAVIKKQYIFLHSWQSMYKQSVLMLQWWMCPKWIQVWPCPRLLQWKWREGLPWVLFNLCSVFGFICWPFGILINLLGLLMDRSVNNMTLVIEISWKILLWISSDDLIGFYFWEVFQVCPILYFSS